MKKTLCILLTLLMLLPTIGCQRAAQTPSDQASDTSAVGGTTAPNTDLAVTPIAARQVEAPLVSPIRMDMDHTMLSTYEFIDRHFIDEMYDIRPIGLLVSEAELQKYIDEVYNTLSPDEIHATPNVYKLIQYFSIDMEAFLAILDEAEEQFGTSLETWMIDALYTEDTNTMLQTLMRPTAFYHGGKIYCMREMAGLSREKCLALGITGAQLNVYVNRLFVEKETLTYPTDMFNYICWVTSAVNSIEQSASENYACCGDTIDRRFIDDVYNVISLFPLVGDAVETYFEEEYPKIPFENRDDTPDMYKLLQYFDISKEEYLSVLDEVAQKYGEPLDMWIIDALYAEDMNTMLEALASPIALYHNGKVYSIGEMASMPLETCLELGITAEQMDAYVERLLAAELNSWRKELFYSISALADGVRAIREGAMLRTAEQHERRFVDEAYDTRAIRLIVGDEKVDRYIEEVYRNIPQNEIDRTPDLYKMIQYFGISKEELLSVADEFEQTFGKPLKTEIVEALYADRNTMLETLTSPMAFYYDGWVCSIDEMADMSLGMCLKLGITADQIGTYVGGFLAVDPSDRYQEAFYDTFYALLTALNAAEATAA